MEKKIASVLVLSLVLLSLIFAINKREKEIEQEIEAYETQALSHTLFDRNAGTLQSIHDYENNHRIAAFYPTFEIETIDKEVKSYIDSRIDEFVKERELHMEQERPILNIDYNSYQINDRFVSLYFEENIYSERYANAHKIPKVMLLDLEHQRVVGVDSFFKGNYLETLSEISLNHLKDHNDDLFKEGLEPTPQNFKNIVFKKDGLVIVFEKYQVLPGYLGQQEIGIKYDQVKDFLVYDTNGKKIETILEPTLPEVEKPPIQPEKPQTPKPVEGVKYVAFTFDDGPFPEVTNRILDALESVNGHGTFFVVGNRVQQFPDTIKRLYNNGHQIGNHTYNHPDLTKLGSNSILEQLQLSNNALASVIGVGADIVRPTFGATNNNVINTVAFPMINWTVDSLDWKSRNSKSIISIVNQNIQANSIVLFHDLYPSTAEAIERLIVSLSQEGYQFVTISELAALNGVTLNPHQVYWQIK